MPTFAETRCQAAIVEQASDGIGDGRDVAILNQQAVVSVCHHLDNPTDTRGDDRLAVRPSLKVDDPERFGARR